MVGQRPALLGRDCDIARKSTWSVCPNKLAIPANARKSCLAAVACTTYDERVKRHMGTSMRRTTVRHQRFGADRDTPRRLVSHNQWRLTNTALAEVAADLRTTDTNSV